MTPPPLIDQSGRPFALDRQLDEGGEATVFTLPNDPERLAKVYKDGHQPDAQKAEKLFAMTAMANPQRLGLLAWPSTLLLSAQSRRVVGFVMPRFTDYQKIQSLYNPVQRLRQFPRAGWKFQVCAAQNLAAAFDEVHKVGCLIGDVNESNVFVSQNALVRLLDCDSFQVRAGNKEYPCEGVGKPYYIPPELQGVHLRGAVRSRNHDLYGLAVLTYQLLFVGKHPYNGLYSGPGDPPFQQLISEYRFAQGPFARSWGMAPPPHTPTFDDIPPDLAILFRRAFERGSESGSRPGPSEWIAALQRLKENCAECASDEGHQYWRGGKGCVWCRIAARGGPEFYFGVSGKAGAFEVDEAKLREIERRLAAAQIPDFPYDRSRFLPPTRPVGSPLPVESEPLLAKWKAGEANLARLMAARQTAELQEVSQAESRERQQIVQLEEEHQQLEDEIEEEIEAEHQTSKEERRDRDAMTVVLWVVVGVGIAMFPLGLLHRAFAAIGLITACVFGIWLGIHHAYSPASTSRRRIAALRREREHLRDTTERRIRAVKDETKRAVRAARETTQEFRRLRERPVREAETAYRDRVRAEATARRRRYEEAESALLAIERNWVSLVNGFKQSYQQLAGVIQSMVLESRGLVDRYQVDVQRIAAKAEMEARVRHLRLHSIADADIPDIGPSRKSALAARGVNTAWDVDEKAIRSIKGFGEKLTGRLIAWKNEVHATFRFDPARAIPPSESVAIAVPYRTRQQQISTELGRLLAELEGLAPMCRAALQNLIPGLQTSIAAWARADADQRVLPP